MERKMFKGAARALAGAAAFTAAGYIALVAITRARYGDGKFSDGDVKDSLLDRFIPEPEVVEHHQIAIGAPADVVIATAKEMHLMNSPIVRAIIRARELAMGGAPDVRPHPSTLFEQMQSIGWVVLSERAGREVVLGAVTQPWMAAPVFRSIPPHEFREFAEPGYVKIAWTLRADPIDARHSMFHTETRVVTTDPAARDRFRHYWSFVAPGVKLIRMAMLLPLRRAAESRIQKAA